MYLTEGLKEVLFRLKKSDLIEVIESLLYQVEEYQESQRQHLVDRQKLIFLKDKIIDEKDREIEWQKNTLHARNHERRKLEREIELLKSREKTKH